MTKSDGESAGGLTWSIRPSFVEYVQRAEGEITCVGGAIDLEDGRFWWPEAPELAPVDSVPNNLRFTGSVNFGAHVGLLDVRVADPVISLEGEGALGISLRSQIVWIVRLPAVVTSVSSRGTRVKCIAPTLTSSGAAIFGGVYPPGAEMGPLDAIVGAQPR